MNKSDKITRVQEAIDILDMLEYFSSLAAQGKREEVPWPGISTSMRQCRNSLLEVLAEIDREPLEIRTPRYEEPSTQRKKISSLARRVRPAPTSQGQVRELLGPNENGSSMVYGEVSDDGQRGES